MTPKNRHRWQMEVDIMKRLHHDNVVVALEVPPELNVSKDELPLLAMEYCSRGDLRKVCCFQLHLCFLLLFIHISLKKIKNIPLQQ